MPESQGGQQAVHIWKTEEPDLLLPDSCREEALKLQEDSMADDGKIGIITEFLKDKQHTCALEIWTRALNEIGRPQKWQASEINNIVGNLPGWERMKNPAKFGEFGSQRGFQRNGAGEADQEIGFMNLDDKEAPELPFS